MQTQKTVSSYRKQFSRDYAVMVAKTLVFTIEDMQILGIDNMNECLEDCLTDIMQRYDISKTEIKVRSDNTMN